LIGLPVAVAQFLGVADEPRKLLLDGLELGGDRPPCVRRLVVSLKAAWSFWMASNQFGFSRLGYGSLMLHLAAFRRSFQAEINCRS
jgi:hypothetical protein